MTTRHNPERRAWRGRSYRKGGKRIRELRYQLVNEQDRRWTVTEEFPDNPSTKIT